MFVTSTEHRLWLAWVTLLPSAGREQVGSDNLYHLGSASSAKAFTAFSPRLLFFPFLVTFWEDESFGKDESSPRS